MAKTVTLTARFPEELAAALEAVSLIRKRPMGALMRDAVEAYLSEVDGEALVAEFQAAASARRAEDDRIASLAAVGVRQSKAARVPVGAGAPAEPDDSDPDH